MALTDDLNKLAAQDVVYITRRVGGGSAEVFRGRVRQALSGNWVFNASTGQNGVVGFILGFPNQNWNSGESPSTGLQVTISQQVFAVFIPNQQQQTLNEFIILTTLIPTDFTD